MHVQLLAITPKAVELIEFAARTCYRSADKSRPGSAEKFLPPLIARGHESPLEHATATFRISGCSRAMTHQLVRHRLMSVSQQSQRYVSEDNFEFVVPPSLSPDDLPEYRRDMETLRLMYAKWKKRGLKKEDARFVLPNACATDIVISANFREFRHIFKVRCSPHAQWEIRDACVAMLKTLNEHAPCIFGDLMKLAGR
ncbi:MAG: FAD-dependent thymidylate synthase [Lentisphaerae bacterium]|nr:FAD-dependent thymidylate synthase [Lentisphaerota bacterium]